MHALSLRVRERRRPPPPAVAQGVVSLPARAARHMALMGGWRSVRQVAALAALAAAFSYGGWRLADRWQSRQPDRQAPAAAAAAP
jgi:hypothetical protein